MPKAGIQACRSTNWKSAEAGSKRDHSSSVSANTSSEMTSAIWRTTRSLLSASRTNDKSRAPAIGSAISEERIGKCINVRSRPQVISKDGYDAQEQRCRIRPYRSGLHTPQQLAQPAHALGDAVDGPVDHARVD